MIDLINMTPTKSTMTFQTLIFPQLLLKLLESLRCKKFLPWNHVTHSQHFLLWLTSTVVSYHILTKDFLIGKDVTSSPWFYVFAVSISYTALRELGQIIAERLRWFFSLWNYLDIATIVLVINSLFQMSHNGEPRIVLIVMTTTFLWLKAIFFLRSTFVSFAVFVGGILNIISDLIPFIVISSLILMAFGEIFAVTLLNERKEECNVEDHSEFNSMTDFCTFQDSLFITYGLFLEGIGLEFYSQAGSMMRIISMVFGFLVVIILLNVVIAIVSKSWSKAVEHGEEVVSIRS